MKQTTYKSQPSLLTEGGVDVHAKIVIECPYCDRRQYTQATLSTYRPQILLCDIEQGGCDLWFAVSLNLEVTATSMGFDQERSDDYDS